MRPSYNGRGRRFQEVQCNGCHASYAGVLKDLEDGDLRLGIQAMKSVLYSFQKVLVNLWTFAL